MRFHVSMHASRLPFGELAGGHGAIIQDRGRFEHGDSPLRGNVLNRAIRRLGLIPPHALVFAPSIGGLDGNASLGPPEGAKLDRDSLHTRRSKVLTEFLEATA